MGVVHWRGRTRPRGPSDRGAPGRKPGVNPQKSSTLRGARGSFSGRPRGSVVAPLDNTIKELASNRLGPGTSTGPPQRALAKTANRPKVTFGPAPPVAGFSQFSHLRAGQYRGHDRCRGRVTSNGGRACRGKHATASVAGSSLSGILGLPIWQPYLPKFGFISRLPHRARVVLRDFRKTPAL